MSYQKKSLILQELQQAIKKKAQEKSRNKEQVNRALQGSIEKKKNVLKTATNKDNRIASIHKNSQTASKQNLPDKSVSIFNNQHLNVFESSEFKAKKYNNRRLDKLVSLVQYMISSSEKALRYISSTNFQAEFALKLYRSDRQNLVNQLKNLNFDDIIDSQRHYDHGGKQDQTFNVLLQENNKLKKEILILEKEAQTYHNKLKDGESVELKHLQKENVKLRQMLRKLMPFEGFKQVMELLEKENKFEIMSIKCQENSKKTTEIQIVITSIENERACIVEGLSRAKDGKSQRSYKMSEIQGEKEQLQRELAQMKSKLSQIIDSGKSISQLQLLKKNSELITEKLASLSKELSPNSSIKRSSEQLLEQIKNISLALQQKNIQLLQSVSKYSQENEDMRKQVARLSEQKKQLENELRAEQQQIRMQNMLLEIGKLRDIVDQLSQQQENSTHKISELVEEIKIKEERIQDLTIELQKESQRSNDMETIVNEMKSQMHVATKRLEEKQKFYRDKLNKMQDINAKLEEEISDRNDENFELRNNLDEVIRRNQSREDSKLLFTEKMNIDYQSRQKEFQHEQTALEREIQIKQSQIVELQTQIELIKNERDVALESVSERQEQITQLQEIVRKLKQSQKDANKKVDALDEDHSELNQQIKQLQGELARLRKENASLAQKLRITQNQIISNTYSKDELAFASAEKQNLMKWIETANAKITDLQEQIKQTEDELQEKQTLIEELQTRISKEVAQKRKAELKQHQTGRNLNTLKQELDFLQKEKESTQKLMQQQRQRYISEFQNLNNRLHESEMLNIQLTKEKVQAKQSLEVEKENIESLNHKISIMQQQMKELQDEIRSLTLLSNQALGQREQSREFINHIEEDRENLKIQLNTTKQQIQDHSELNRFKNKQYVNLLKQILKGLQIDPSEYADRSTFQELLEFGSKQAVQLRKRQRQQESNKRKNVKREYDGSITEYYEPILEDCKVQLFDSSDTHQILERQSEDDEKIDIEHFGQLKEEINNSMISQQHHDQHQEPKGAQLQEFNDLQSQKMSQSMISNDMQDKLPEKLSLNSIHRSQQLKVHEESIENVHYDLQEHEKQNLSQFNDLQENINDSMMSENQPMKDDQSFQKQNQQKIDQHHKDSNIPQNTSINQMENHSVLFFNDPNFKIQLKQTKEKRQQNPNRPYSKHTLLSIALKDEKLDLDEFEQVKSVDDNNSVVSNNDFHEEHQEFATHHNEELSNSDVEIYPLNLIQSEEKDVDLDEFKEMEADPLSASMLSEKEQQVNIDEFGDIAMSGLGESMISVQQNQKLSINSTPSKEPLGLDEFGEVQEQMNDSMLSENKSEHGLSEFGELTQEKLNQSLLSEKQQKQHGMSQFGEIQDDRMNDSILSQNMNALMKPNHSAQEGHFEDFDEYQSNKMSESMISQKQGGILGKGVLSEESGSPRQSIE